MISNQNTSWPQLFRNLFVTPILSEPYRLILIFVSLVILSSSQSLLLLSIGPFFKSLFSQVGQDPYFNLTEFLPDNFVSILPTYWAQLRFDRSVLSWFIPLSMLVSVILKGISTYTFQLNQQAVSFNVSKTYRDELFSAILKMPLAKIAKREPGDWMSLIMNDVLYLQSRFSEFVATALKDSILVVTAIVMMVMIHWPTALCMLLLAPFLFFYLGRKGKRISSYSEAWQRRLAEMSGRILSLRQRFVFIRAQGGEKREAELFKELNDDYLKMIRESIFLRAIIGPGMEFIGFALFAGILWLMTHRLWKHGFGPAELLQFFGAIGLILKPLRTMGEQYARMYETKGALNQGLQAFTEAWKVQEEEASTDKTSQETDLDCISIDKVEAGYDGHVRFSMQDLELKRGHSIAIIGESGSGKSTLVKSLVGLIKPILWESKNPWSALSNQMAFVSQRPFMFSDSIRDNLCYGAGRDIDDQELWSVLAKVKMDDLVRNMGQGLDSLVDSIQSNLSGGQIQRLALCRALLTKRPFLVLDEAASALDQENEQQLTNLCLDQVRQGPSGLVFITHRLRWLSLFDEVLYVKQGKVVMRGPHQELLKSAEYRRYIEQAQD